MTPEHASLLIKEAAYKVGFAACGIAQVAPASTEASYFDQWIAAGHHASMQYMENYRSLRLNPTDLIPGAQSIICVAINYFPSVRQAPNAPQIAYYAYGKDYHLVMKAKLQQLCTELIEPLGILPATTQARSFTDSAPLLERYWAWKAGLGWIGKNTNLIIPKQGSYFFLGELVVDIPLAYDVPIQNRCGSCTQCLQQCPTGALEAPQQLNANKCLSYLTIEHKGEIPTQHAAKLDKRFYGCDTCQQVCPWNRFAHPTQEPAFAPNPALLSLDEATLSTLTREQYQQIFKHSAVKRAKYEGLMRTQAQRTKGEQ